ncbi:MAG: hypothetical protein RLY97_1476, partial [Pseudomonadota bacterium]
WKSKPIGAPFNKIFLFDYGYPIGMTRSLPGEGWFCLGWIGVIVVCGVWGAGLGYIYKRYVLSSQNTIVTASYMMFLPTLIIAYRDGQMMTIFRQGIFFQAPIILWMYFGRYLGIPSAQEVRELIRFRRKILPAAAKQMAAGPTSSDNGKAQQPNDGISDAIKAQSHLPSAVKRRRLALRMREISAK